MTDWITTDPVRAYPTFLVAAMRIDVAEREALCDSLDMKTTALVKAGWTKRQESRSEWSYTSPSGKVQVWTRSGWAHGVEISVGERRAVGHFSTAFALRAESLVSRWA